MSNPDFVYTTYIKTTPEKLWNALTNPEFTRQYWMHENISDWKKGSDWKSVTADAAREVRILGRVIESVPHKRLVFTWAAPSDKADESRVTFEIEPAGEMVQLNVVHGDFKPGSIMAGRVVQGWPRVLSSLKSLLETGKALDMSGMKNSCGSDAQKKGAAA